MAYPAIATLNGSDLPDQFSYKPYVPRKRTSVTPTSNSVLVQYANPQIVHGDSILSWSCDAATPTEFSTLWGLYNTNIPELYTFVGYWGETLKVYFNSMEVQRVRGRLFNLSGSFLVESVVSGYSPACYGVV